MFQTSLLKLAKNNFTVTLTYAHLAPSSAIIKPNFFKYLQFMAFLTIDVLL